MAPKDEAGVEAGHLRRYLESQGNRFVYQRTIGNGAFGVACLIRHNRSDGTQRDIVVKRALREADQRNLEKEIDLAKVRSSPMYSPCPPPAVAPIANFEPFVNRDWGAVFTSPCPSTSTVTLSRKCPGPS